jgi:hypothetical protein
MTKDTLIAAIDAYIGEIPLPADSNTSEDPNVIKTKDLHVKLNAVKSALNDVLFKGGKRRRRTKRKGRKGKKSRKH